MKLKSLGIYDGLPASIYVLFVVRIINALGAFVGPFITLFLSNKLGYSNDIIGLFIMVNSLCMVPGAMIGGKISDILGRKKILIAFQLLTGTSYLLCAFFERSQIIPYLLIMASFFNSATQPAFGAMTADLSNVKNRKSAYSLLYLGVNLGFSIGPMIAGFLYNNYITMLFIGNSAAVFISTAVLYFFVEETIPNNMESNCNIDENAEEGSLINALIKRPCLLVFLLFSTIYSFVYAQYPYCIPLQVNELFENNGAVIYGQIMAVNGLTVFLFTTFLTRITRKISPIKNVAAAGVFYAFGFGMMYFIKSRQMFYLSAIIWTIGEIIHTINSNVYIANHTPMTHRGRFNAVIPLISSTGFALGPAIMGMYIKNRAVKDGWPVVFVLALTASLLFYILYIHEKKKKSNVY